MKNKVFIVITVLIVVVGVGMIGYGLELPEEKSSAEEGKTSSRGKEINQKYVRFDNGEGGVQVTAILLSSEYLEATGREGVVVGYDLENTLLFEVAMSTHMGDLRKYPILKNASLLVNGEDVQPKDWKLTADESHHPIGLLSFKGQANEISQKANVVIELNLKDLAGVGERKFVWNW